MDNIHEVETMVKCDGCGKDVVHYSYVDGAYGMFCGVCKVRIEKEIAEKEYYEAKKRKLEREG